MSSFQGVGIEGFHCIQRCPILFHISYCSIFWYTLVYSGICISSIFHVPISILFSSILLFLLFSNIFFSILLFYLQILLLKRISPISVQFKWLERFCEEHIDNLPAHLSSRKLKSVRLEKPIVDEESPVINIHLYSLVTYTL